MVEHWESQPHEMVGHWEGAKQGGTRYHMKWWDTGRGPIKQGGTRYHMKWWDTGRGPSKEVPGTT